MKAPGIIYKTALAVFKNKKMIMVRDNRNGTAFYTLGGTIQETGVECLHREVQEEASTQIKEGSLKFLKEFEAAAHGKENALVNIKLFQGELAGNPTPSGEIVEIQYFDTSVDKKHLTPISIEMFQWLKEHDYIN
jgi:8-oxo-dGTP pyrophosphatase MutT (NUDIX family)